MYLAVADEEALGSLGADHLVEHEADAVRADYVITESGRHPDPQPHRPEAPGDRGREGQPLGPAAGVGHARPRQPALQDRQRPGHGGRGGPADRRVPAGHARSTTSGASSSRGWSTPRSWSARCSTPTRLVDACDALPVGMARQFHACTHTTFAPTIAHGGTKINVIPDRVDLQIDIRTLPGRRRGRGAGDARRGARRPGAEGRADRVARRPVDHLADRHAAVGLARPRSPRRSTRARRSSRS